MLRAIFSRMQTESSVASVFVEAPATQVSQHAHRLITSHIKAMQVKLEGISEALVKHHK